MSDSTDKHSPTLPQAELSADELLNRLLELIINTTDVGMLSAPVIEAAFHVHLEPYEDTVFYAARLSDDWNYKIEVSDDELYGPGLYLRFFGNQGDTPASMSDICALDADAFAITLQGAGFDRQTSYGIHGGILGDFLTRGSVRVTTGVRREASELHEKSARGYITAVQVQRL